MYLYVPAWFLLNSNALNLTFPSLSFFTVSISVPSASFNTKLNSFSFNSRPCNFLLKLNSTSTGMFTTRFCVGFSGVLTVLDVGSYWFTT